MTIHTVNGIKLRTDFIYPPIPIRSHDWSAVADDYDGADDSNCPIGYGTTEQEAITDLIEQIEDAAESSTPTTEGKGE